MRARNFGVLVIATLTLSWALFAHAQRQTSAATPSGPAHKFEKIAEGIYYATTSGVITTGSNSVVIVNDAETMIVDPGQTPAAARAFIEDIKTITNKPVKFVIDTHYHYDHAHGNQVFGRDVTVIGHDRTKAHLLSNVLQQRTYLTNGLRPLESRIAELKQQIATETDAAKKTDLQQQLSAQELHLTQEHEVRPTPPGQTFATDLTLHRGSREIQIRYLGRAHTDGDIVVFLPKERIVCTGDMIGAAVNFAGDAFVEEWPATLEKLAAIDFDTMLPGHGRVLTGRDQIRAAQSYWRDFASQVTALRKKGVSPEDAAKQIDMTSHAKDFPAIRAAGVDVRWVDRMYDLAANPNAPVR